MIIDNKYDYVEYLYRYSLKHNECSFSADMSLHSIFI